MKFILDAAPRFHLRFPKAFAAGDVSLGPDFYKNQLKIDERAYKIIKWDPGVFKGRLHVDMTLEGKNIDGNNLVRRR